MTQVNLENGKSAWVATVEDCDINDGGLYCEVYEDDDFVSEPYNTFIITKHQLKINPDEDYWIKLYFNDGDKFIETDGREDW